MQAKRKRRSTTTRPTRKKKVAGTIVMTTLAVGAAGVLGYLGWQSLQRKKKGHSSDLDAALIQPSDPGKAIPSLYPPTATDSSTIRPPKSNPVYELLPAGPPIAPTEFPLKRGSKGPKVKALQQAIISKYGKSLLPRYGADGDFGSETVNALRKLKLPEVVAESVYHVLLQGSSGSPAAKATGRQFYDAVVKKDFSKTISLLKTLFSKEDYNQVSSQYKQYRVGTVRKTLVNGLLDAFASETQKQQIRFEFLRMGLKYDGNKWSLDGLEGPVLITIEPSSIWIDATRNLRVPARMVLGVEVGRRLDFILFENNKKLFLVPARSVKQL